MFFHNLLKPYKECTKMDYHINSNKKKFFEMEISIFVHNEDLSFENVRTYQPSDHCNE